MFDEALWIMCELGPEMLQTIIRNPRENRRVLPGRKLNRPRNLSVVTVKKTEGTVTT